MFSGSNPTGAQWSQRTRTGKRPIDPFCVFRSWRNRRNEASFLLCYLRSEFIKESLLSPVKVLHGLICKLRVRAIHLERQHYSFKVKFYATTRARMLLHSTHVTKLPGHVTMGSSETDRLKHTLGLHETTKPPQQALKQEKRHRKPET